MSATHHTLPETHCGTNPQQIDSTFRYSGLYLQGEKVGALSELHFRSESRWIVYRLFNIGLSTTLKPHESIFNITPSFQSQMVIHCPPSSLSCSRFFDTFNMVEFSFLPLWQYWSDLLTGKKT